jgi:upstream activation factor subunit UAF30
MPGKTTEKKPAGASKTSAFMKPVQPDAVLGAIVGTAPLPRTEVTSKIWDYIRKHNLQDPQDKRTIRADDKLKPFFGGKASVSMLELPKLVKEHLKT